MSCTVYDLILMGGESARGGEIRFSRTLHVPLIYAGSSGGCIAYVCVVRVVGLYTVEEASVQR